MNYCTQVTQKRMHNITHKRCEQKQSKKIQQTAENWKQVQRSTFLTPPPHTLNMFMFVSAADSSKRSKYAVVTRSGNTFAGIQFDPFMNTGSPLIRKKNDLPAKTKPEFATKNSQEK